MHEGKASKLDADSARKMLISMLEGVQLTEKILLQVWSTPPSPPSPSLPAPLA